MFRGVERLTAVVLRRGGVGVLAAVLLLPLTAVEQDTPVVIASPDSDEAVEALAGTAPREGDLDTSFGGDGKVTTDFGGEDQARALAIQPDGKIVVAGADTTFALARYLPNGTLNPTFGHGGTVETYLSRHAWAIALALQLDGKLVVAGRSSETIRGYSLTPPLEQRRAAFFFSPITESVDFPCISERHKNFQAPAVSVNAILRPFPDRTWATTPGARSRQHVSHHPV
jgi:uncharacterized delta-60 repeat protein